MRLSIEFDPDAQNEFNEASDWYRERDQEGKVAFLAEVKATLESILRSPNSYPVVFGSNTRRAVVHRFPYSIFFTPEDDLIFVNAIFHTSRDPLIWHGRIS